MSWSNVKLILAREIRDQLRDWRTMFMIVVLPVLLYPLLGMSFLQFSQFIHAKPVRVLLVGAENLPVAPALVENDRFAERLFRSSERAKQLELRIAGPAMDSPAAARRAVAKGDYEAALLIPPDLGQRLEEFREAVQTQSEQPRRGEGKAAAFSGSVAAIPKLEIIYSTAYQKSQLAFLPLSDMLRQWNEEILKSNLAAARLPESLAAPLETEAVDVANETGYRGAAVWSWLLPIILLLWAMTGAFYPAVDLCAGEKERGTLETLLSSPAQRSEIVLGKLLTIMLFSSVTAALNLLSMSLLGSVMLSRLRDFGPPPLVGVVWLVIALIPVSALFSALCLSLAAFARSTKEGQYYLMPLLLVTMPLSILPAASGMELNLGTSLIPVTGIVLLLRAALEGHYWDAAQFLAPVAGMTLLCCYLSIRWAIDQFNSESVLFRESERLELLLWLRHLLSDRGPTPSPAGAAFCGIVILLVYFFMSFALPPPSGPAGFLITALATQLVVVLTPTLLMTTMLASNARKTLLLFLPRWQTAAAAVALALAVHPIISELQKIVFYLYPINPGMKSALESLQEAMARLPAWKVLLTVALLPALCEELAFRGFVLSGFRHLGHKWRAIVYSAMFFGLSHGVLQQSLIATMIGVVIGFIAVQSGSIVPGMLYHAVHNSLPILALQAPEDAVTRWPLLGYLMCAGEHNEVVFRWPALVVAGLAASAILVWFGRQTYAKSAEERQQEEIAHAAKVTSKPEAFTFRDHSHPGQGVSE